MNLSVARATLDDAIAVQRVAAETFHDACPPGLSREVTDAHVARELNLEKFETWLADARHHVLLATDATTGIAAGYVMMIQDEPIADRHVLADEADRDVAPVWFLSKFYLRSDVRGSGAAQELMATATATARDRGALGMWLTVNQLNTRANAFYERLGFRTVGTATFPMSGQLHDDNVRLLVF